MSIQSAIRGWSDAVCSMPNNLIVICPNISHVQEKNGRQRSKKIAAERRTAEYNPHVVMVVWSCSCLYSQRMLYNALVNHCQALGPFQQNLLRRRLKVLLPADLFKWADCL